jgi:iron complex transport system permease protein
VSSAGLLSPASSPSIDDAPSLLLDRRRRLRRLVVAALAVALALTMILAGGVGAVAISPAQVLAIVLEPLEISGIAEFSAQQAVVLRDVRAPRVVLGAMIGATLGTSGVAMQGLLRNPLADAGLLGVSSGGALVAAICIVLGGSLAASGLPAYALPAGAFIGGLLAVTAVLAIGRSRGRSRIGKVLLAGIGVNAVAGAGLGWLHYVADDAALRTITFWTLGGLGGARWDMIATCALPLAACAVGVPFFARALNVLALGERDARHLGQRVEVVTRALVVLVALGVGAAVAASGIIGFVGLVVPHLLRMALGPDHRGLAFSSALLGATMLVLADLVARVVDAPEEMPVGIVTAAIGAPVFLALLVRDRRGEPTS